MIGVILQILYLTLVIIFGLGAIRKQLDEILKAIKEGR